MSPHLKKSSPLSRLGRGMVVIGLCLSIGLQWAAIQSVAWMSMAVSYSVEKGSVVEVLKQVRAGVLPAWCYSGGWMDGWTDGWMGRMHACMHVYGWLAGRRRHVQRTSVTDVRAHRPIHQPTNQPTHQTPKTFHKRRRAG